MDQTSTERFTEHHGKNTPQSPPPAGGPKGEETNEILPYPPLQKEGANGIPLFRKEGLGEIFGRLRFLLFHVTVTGESMWPALVPGQRYWASSLLPIRPGSIAIAQTEHRLVIKRVGKIKGSNIELISDASNRTSYRVLRSQLLGRLLGV